MSVGWWSSLPPRRFFPPDPAFLRATLPNSLGGSGAPPGFLVWSLGLCRSPDRPERNDMDYKLEVVVVPVSDIDRAKHFYADQMGFNVDVDHQPSEDVRIVQMTPTGSACSVTIGKGLARMDPGSLQAFASRTNSIKSS